MQGWQLREDSLIHQKVLVIAELSWAKRGPAGGVYLVTWEVDGGGLKGNLFTDSTHVTLSLWPDTVYHVQVRSGSRSFAFLPALPFLALPRPAHCLPHALQPTSRWQRPQ